MGSWGKDVVVVGTWVRDKAHSVFNQDIGIGGDTEKGQTEIHPITSLLIKHPPKKPGTRRFELFVFSDESFNHPHAVPNSGVNRIGRFAIAVPVGTSPPVLSLEDDLASSASFGVSPAGSYSVLRGTISSGRPDAGKGFYRAIFEVPALFSLRALLEHPWVGPIEPCATLAKELRELKNGTARTFDPQLKIWVDVESTPQAIAAKQQELDDCLAQHEGDDSPTISLRETVRMVPAVSPCERLARELVALKNGTARRFDPELKSWIEIPSTPAAIAAKQDALDECLEERPAPAGFSLRALIEAAYP